MRGDPGSGAVAGPPAAPASGLPAGPAPAPVPGRTRTPLSGSPSGLVLTSRPYAPGAPRSGLSR